MQISYENHSAEDLRHILEYLSKKFNFALAIESSPKILEEILNEKKMILGLLQEKEAYPTKSN